ncbi:hypothetical protein GMSM_23090 [Geomonas sp. Red276]
MDEKKATCVCAGRHEQHICYLHSKGMVEEVEKLTDNPTVTCAICLVNANSPDNVCSPTTLGGGFKYSDMRDSKKIICDSVIVQDPPDEEK